MDQLEEGLRRALHDPRRALPVAADPVEPVRRGMRRRRGRRAGLAGALAVLVLGGGAAALVVPGTSRSPVPATGPSVVTAPVGPTSPPSSPPATAAARRPGGPPVPAGFRAADLSFVSAGTGWALGTAPCSTAPCTSLLRTDDGGRTWYGGPAPVAYLPALDHSQACGTSGCISGLRFANSEVGYAYGPALLMTTDGGATWQRQTAPPVLALEAARGTVLRVVTNTPGCPPYCSTVVQRAAVGGHTWTSVYTPPVRAGDVELLRQGGQVALLVKGNLAGGSGDARTAFSVSRDGGTTWTDRPDPCSPGTSNDPAESDAVSGAFAPDGTLVVLCRVRSQARTPPNTVVRSSDAGLSFSAPVVAPRDVVSVAAATADRWVVETASGGYDTLRLTTDGGRSWHDVAQQGGVGNSFLAFTTALTAHWVGAQPAVWVTTDGGRTWRSSALR